MEINDLIAALTEGLSPEDAAVVRKSIERDAVKSKASGWKQANEYQALETRQRELQTALEGDAASGKLGAKAYQEWYDKNFPAVQKFQKDLAAYEAKFGKLDDAAPPTPGTPPTGKQYTDADIQRMVDERIQNGYAGRWSELLVSTGDLVQRHMFAGRKTPIDMKKVSELAAQKYNGDLGLAYDEWDKPVRDQLAKEATDAEVDRRVKEELQKRGASTQFPVGADMSQGSLSARTKDDVAKYDRTAFTRDLASTFMEAGTKQ